jgi:hypothetical protein
MRSLEKMLPLRDDFIEFTLTLFKYQESIDLDQLHGFWERLIALTVRPESVQSWRETDFDNYRFFNYELVLSFISLLLRLRKVCGSGAFHLRPVFFSE